MDKKRKNSSAQRSAEPAGNRSSGSAGSRAVRSPDTVRRSGGYSGYGAEYSGYRSSYSSGRYSSGSPAARADSSRDTQRSYSRSSAAQRTGYGGSGYSYSGRQEAQRRITDADRRRRLEQERKRRILRQKRIRAAALFGLLLLCAIILIFMTPLFNIRQITLEGNSSVTKEQIQEKVGDLIGKNLFAVTAGKIESRVMEIPQVDTAEAAKKLFPPSVRLSITECSPAAYLLSGNRIIVIDSDLKIIDDSNSFDTDVIPSISGISIPSYTVNTRLTSDSAEKEEILSVMLKTFEATGLLQSVSYISLDDLSNIKFNYNNRIEADCGSQLELERKIRMFAAAVSSNSMDTNTAGSIDLSVPGTAVLDR